MRAAAALVALAACGRVGFDALGDGSTLGGDTPGAFDGVHHTLRLDKLAPGTPLADFPLPVILDDARANRSLFAADLSDVRFYHSSGNVLAHEIEQAGQPGGAPTIIAALRDQVITY